jgi:hypothetical protein
MANNGGNREEKRGTPGSAGFERRRAMLPDQVSKGQVEYTALVEFRRKINASTYVGGAQYLTCPCIWVTEQVSKGQVEYTALVRFRRQINASLMQTVPNI